MPRLLMLVGPMLAVSTVAAQTPTFKSGIRTVSVYATVQGSDGRLVPDLTVHDFELRDDGRRVDISHFSRDVQPLAA